VDEEFRSRVSQRGFLGRGPEGVVCKAMVGNPFGLNSKGRVGMTV